MKHLPTILVLANLLLVLAVVNGAIFQKEAIVDTGQIVFLELAPVDPRSLMQGDYMILTYGLSRGPKVSQTRGAFVLALDERRVGTFDRLASEAELRGELAEDKALLQFRKWRGGFKFGIESFFFQEGHAERYDRAKFAEIRVSAAGKPVLVDLHDAIP